MSIEQAAQAVANDMVRKPPSASDGICRFDRIIEPILGHLGKKNLQEVAQVAWKKNAGKETWDANGYGIVASWAETKAAFLTPGFAEARSKYMT